jgi:hypothetical protein
MSRCVRLVIFLATLGVPAPKAQAVVLSVLHQFAADGSEGSGIPQVMLGSDGQLYGTLAGGGTMNDGTLFSMGQDGTAFQILHNFDNTDGAFPTGRLIQSGSTFFGTAQGGDQNRGIAYSFDTTGNVFNVTHRFAGAPAEGSLPSSSLFASGSQLLGITTAGGTTDNGTIYSVNPTDGSYQTLHDFDASQSQPRGLAGTGTTLFGFSKSGSGSIFSFDSATSNLETIYNFSASTPPIGTLIQAGNHLFGLSAGPGTIDVFMVNTDGTGFSIIGSPPGDGIVAESFVQFGSRVYGTTGGLFSFNLDGTDFRNETTTGFVGRISFLASAGDMLLATSNRNTSLSTVVLVVQVPEPNSILLAACCLIALLAVVTRRNGLLSRKALG